MVKVNCVAKVNDWGEFFPRAYSVLDEECFENIPRSIIGTYERLSYLDVADAEFVVMGSTDNDIAFIYCPFKDVSYLIKKTALNIVGVIYSE